MTSPKFRTTRGRLTAYAMACGYVASAWAGRVNVNLWQAHGTYHVRAHDHGNRRRVFWDSFSTLGAARRRYDLARKESTS